MATMHQTQPTTKIVDSIKSKSVPSPETTAPTEGSYLTKMVENMQWKWYDLLNLFVGRNDLVYCVEKYPYADPEADNVINNALIELVHHIFDQYRYDCNHTPNGKNIISTNLLATINANQPLIKDRDAGNFLMFFSSYLRNPDTRHVASMMLLGWWNHQGEIITKRLQYEAVEKRLTLDLWLSNQGKITADAVPK